MAKHISPIFFHLLAATFFLLDLAAFSFFERTLLYSLLCFYILSLSGIVTIPRILFVSLLLSLASLIQTGHFGICLLYVIPATALGISIKHMLYGSYWQYYLLLAACLLAQVFLIECWILGLSWSISYTISILFVNILVIWIMSLKSYN